MQPSDFMAIRERSGLSRGQLAKVLGIKDHSSIWRYEHGESYISGPVSRLMEMLDRGELPGRYLELARKVKAHG